MPSSRSPSRGRAATRDRSPTRSRTPSRRSGSGRDRSRGRSLTPRHDSRSPSRTPLRSASPRRNGRRSYTPDGRSRSRTPRSRARSHSRSPSRRSGSPAPRSAKIVVEQLSKNVHEGHLREIFGKFGPIRDLVLPMNPMFNVNRGTAYIMYQEIDDAERAIAKMHEAQLDGTKILVSIVLPRRRFSRSPPSLRRGPPPRDRDYDYRPGGPAGSYRPPPMGGPPRYRSRSPPGGYRGRGGRGRGRGGRGDFEYRPRRSPSRSRSPRRSRSRSWDSRTPSRSPHRRGGGYRRRESPPPPRRGGGRHGGGGGGGGGGGSRRSRSFDSYSDRRSSSRSWSRGPRR